MEGRNLDSPRKKWMITFRVTVKEIFCTKWGNKDIFCLVLGTEWKGRGKKIFPRCNHKWIYDPKLYYIWFKKEKKNLKRIQFEVVSVGFAFLTLNPTQKIFKENKLTTKLKIHIETRHYLWEPGETPKIKNKKTLNAEY